MFSRSLNCTISAAECDGTGEPNVEEQVMAVLTSAVLIRLLLYVAMNLTFRNVMQFLDWVEEGAKCPYCAGLGYTVCDVCDGKAVA